MAEYRLYCFAQSGNAYKAALMLQLCGADWEPRFVDFFNGEQRTPEFRRLNEMGEVPVLEHGDLRLTQSGVILDYLAERFGKFGWASEDERREILRWLLWDNHKLTSYVATLRFLLRFMKTGETPVTEFLRGRVQQRACGPERPSRGPAVRGRRAPDHRRHLHVRLPVLAGRVRRQLERAPPDRGLAGADQGAARLDPSLRADARPSLARAKLIGRGTSGATDHPRAQARLPRQQWRHRHSCRRRRGRGLSNQRMINVLTLSSLYPNRDMPQHGIFVENRLRRLLASGEVASLVVAPVPWFPFDNQRFGRYATFAGVPREERRHGITVLHPPLCPDPQGRHVLGSRS